LKSNLQLRVEVGLQLPSDGRRMLRSDSSSLESEWASEGALDLSAWWRRRICETNRR
jgi:hypothetical protein